MHTIQEFLFLLTFSLAVGVMPARAQILPDTIYQWTKSAEALLESPARGNPAGATREVVEAFGAIEWRIAEYERAGRSARIDCAQFPSRERAYGFFRWMADNAAPEGIIGDAFGARGGVAHVNTGPFYFRVSTGEGRAAASVDDALLERIRRVLHTRADCYGSDFPFPTEERMIGSERYYPPDPRVWRDTPPRGTEDVLSAIATRAAYAAEYRLARSGLRRTLLSFPFRGREAAAEFAAELVQQLQSRPGSRRGTCDLPSFTQGGVTHLVAAAPTRVLLVITDPADAGCCAWLHGMLR